MRRAYKFPISWLALFGEFFKFLSFFFDLIFVKILSL